MKARHPDAIVVRFDDMLMIPGLVDSHVHLPQYDAVATEDDGLLQWLNHHIFPLESSFADPKKARDVARRFFGDLPKNGTTTASVFVTIHEEATDIAFEAAKLSGVRAIIGKVMMDTNSPPDLRETTEDSLAKSERLCRTWHGTENGRLSYAFTPRFAVTCSSRLLRESAKLANRYDAHIQTHLAETPDEVTVALKLHIGATSYTDIYHQAGLLRPKSIFAHSIYLSKKEIALLANTGAGAAHCPASNLFLQSGMMKVDELLEAGVNVGLGSDIAGGPELNMFRCMALAGYSSKARLIQGRLNHQRRLSRVVDPDLAFYLATLGGAKALGLGGKIGSFEKGKRADFVIIDTRKIDTVRRAPTELETGRILSLLMYRATDAAVAATYVDGRCVWRA